jgi:hypothetical protein
VIAIARRSRNQKARLNTEGTEKGGETRHRLCMSRSRPFSLERDRANKVKPAGIALPVWKEYKKS